MFGWGKKREERVEHRVDRSSQVLAILVPEHDLEGDDELRPVPRTDAFVSASVLAHKARQFDDGLYAAVELAATPDVHAILRRWMRSPAPPVVHAAAHLAGLDVPPLPMVREFLENELQSKPIGFYTWSEDLARVFRRDRMLQTPLRAPDESFLATAQGDPDWERHLAFVQRLTNPFVHGASILPPSRSHETDLMRRLYGDRPIPEGFQVIDQIIRGVREGRLDLRPRPESGWYDHQTWALEPLLRLEAMPEAARLKFNPGYRKLLEDLFKGILALTRETHVKQVEMCMAGCGPPGEPETVIEVRPELRVEPLVSHYRRRADAYRFVSTLVRDRFPSLRRETPEGPLRVSLRDELDSMISLFDGAAAEASRGLGLPGEGELRLDPGDPDLARDCRMMVPVFHDVERRKTKVWAFLGWSDRPVHISFDVPPKVEIVKGKARVEFGSISPRLSYPVCEEIYVTRILNRDEFRSLCDRHSTREKILSALP